MTDYSYSWAAILVAVPTMSLVIEVVTRRRRDHPSGTLWRYVDVGMAAGCATLFLVAAWASWYLGRWVLFWPELYGAGVYGWLAWVGVGGGRPPRGRRRRVVRGWFRRAHPQLTTV